MFLWKHTLFFMQLGPRAGACPTQILCYPKSSSLLETPLTDKSSSQHMFAHSMHEPSCWGFSTVWLLPREKFQSSRRKIDGWLLIECKSCWLAFPTHQTHRASMIVLFFFIHTHFESFIIFSILIWLLLSMWEGFYMYSGKTQSPNNQLFDNI